MNIYYITDILKTYNLASSLNDGGSRHIYVHLTLFPQLGVPFTQYQH